MTKYIDDNLESLSPKNRKNEKILMTNFSTFHEGTEKLLGRPVFTHEFGININGLKEEAKKASLLDSGESLETSDSYKSKKVQESIDSLGIH